ncbi:MAG: GNAT family N-acetyltransferase [Mariniphaga sp.]|nr:GNAT family N-acetyltransferase [Mariniphaga sp.]
MAFIIKRTFPNDPQFTSLIEFLNKELWERNPVRQGEYESHNLLDPETSCVIAFDDKKPIATGAFRILKDDKAEIKRMYVLPEYRGKGISKLVLSELETWAKEQELSTAVLETGLNHPEAISLYQKSGYRKIKNYGPYKILPESICMGTEL